MSNDDIYKKIDFLSNCFEDEESTYIFNRRVKYMLTHDIVELFKIVNETYKYSNINYINQNTIDKMIINYDHKKAEKSTIIILGCGRVAKEVYDVLTLANIFAQYMCITKYEENICNNIPLEIISFDEIPKIKNKTIIVAIETYNFSEVKKLIQLGVGINDLVFLRRRELQYFGRPYFVPTENEVFVDAGAMDGETLSFFNQWCKGKYKKIYSFEPDKQNYKMLIHNIQSNKLKNVKAYNLGIYDVKTTMAFEMQGTPSSNININGTEKVSVDLLDNIIGDDKVTFIKMDIEGSELNALMGSEKVIKRDHPKLAICLYHKDTDIVEIPYYIKKIAPMYHFKIRHHSWGRNETVLYAFV